MKHQKGEVITATIAVMAIMMVAMWAWKGHMMGPMGMMPHDHGQSAEAPKTQPQDSSTPSKQ